jgi:hypothetical protein
MTLFEFIFTVFFVGIVGVLAYNFFCDVFDV